MDRQAGTWVAEREVGLYRYLSKLKDALSM